jgi:hypothetical protein
VAQTVNTDDPVQTVITYYRFLAQGDVAAAAELMRDGPGAWGSAFAGPVAEGRVAVKRAEVLSIDAYQRQATVAVELEATTDQPAAKQHYIVNWQLARGPAGWRLAAATP